MMTTQQNKRKTISLPAEIHHKVCEIAKRAEMKQYEFIASAIDLADSDETFFQAIIEQHKQKKRIKSSLKGIDSAVIKKLEALSPEDLQGLLENLKKQ
ncbi:MAG: hypothetical protein ABL903_19530 [Methylococcales bacterium]